MCSQQGHSAHLCPLLRQQWTFNPPSPMPGSQRGLFFVPYVPAPHAYFLGNTPTVNTASSFWLVDAGASHHVSMDLQNLASHSKYDDIDEITVGNGNNLNITHTSSTHLSSSSKSFLLSNVLCVPSMQ